MESYSKNPQHESLYTEAGFLESYQKIHYFLELFANSKTLSSSEKDTTRYLITEELKKLGIVSGEENPIIILERMKEKYIAC